MNNIKIKEIVAKGYINPSKLPGYDYVINPYVGCPHRCIYCYAEFMKRFSSHDEEWGTFTDVKIRSTAVKPVYLQNKNVFLSSVTDCYNPLEEKYCLTRQLLEKLRFSGANITILTKSDLVLRDIDILQQIPHVTVGFSLNTTDDVFRQQIEPCASSVLSRLYALKTLHENGIRTWVHVAPIFPELSDWKAILEAAEGFTDSFSFENLKLSYTALPRVLLYITQQQPDVQELYDLIYHEKKMDYWHKLRQEILDFCKERNLAATIHFSEENAPQE
ncbi:MAG: radical SAM protein [Elusimicrobiaceae bacterium]|nr:radical SAM protein [Elusimicrobiaceae bacterium]